MKFALAFSLLSAIALSVAQGADTTVVITGATSFRQAALQSIRAAYSASGQPFKFAHDAPNSTPYYQSTRSVWVGTFQGVTGTTTIRCYFNGSVEGIKTLSQTSSSIPLINPAVLNSVVATIGGTQLPNETSFQYVTTQADLAFSNVSKSSTPYAAATLLPTGPSAEIAIATFTMIANEGAPAGLDNVTSQQYRLLISGGYAPLSLFTGTGSDTTLVFATGRNDAAGARTFALAETGYGITNVVQQYVAGAFTGTTITQIHRVPQGGYSASVPGSSVGNRSTAWGADIDGNGGYGSDYNLQIDMGRTTGSTMVVDADGSTLLPAGPIHLVTMISTADAVEAIARGAKVLSYNGVGITPTNAGLSAADKMRITRGQYTLWTYERLYRNQGITGGDKLQVYNGIKSYIGSYLAPCGIPLIDMQVGRTTDGGLVGP